MKRFALLVAVLLSSSCADTPEAPSSAPVTPKARFLFSMRGLSRRSWRRGWGPLYPRLTGHEYKGEAQGSLGAARLIRDGLRPSPSSPRSWPSTTSIPSWRWRRRRWAIQDLIRQRLDGLEIAA